jgi:hypothetical protein
MQSRRLLRSASGFFVPAIATYRQKTNEDSAQFGPNAGKRVRFQSVLTMAAPSR